MSRVVPCLAGALYFVTRRTVGGTFRLRPDLYVNQLIEYCLAVASRKYRVGAARFIVLSSAKHVPRGLDERTATPSGSGYSLLWVRILSQTLSAELDSLRQNPWANVPPPAPQAAAHTTLEPKLPMGDGAGSEPPARTV